MLNICEVKQSTEMEYTVANGSYFGRSSTMCTPLHIIYPLPAPVASDHFGGSSYTPSPPISSPPLHNDSNSQEQDQPFTLMQMNGRKVLGPPEDWQGPPPSSACELFVRRIPRNIDEQRLIQPFLRFGQIYEMRLPMDFNQVKNLKSIHIFRCVVNMLHTYIHIF